MTEKFVTILLAATGIVAGMAAGIIVVVAVTPMWPLALLMVAFLPVGYWTSHRPWHGKRKKGEFKKMLKDLFGPPITDNGYALGVGAAVGLVVSVAFFGRMIWGNL